MEARKYYLEQWNALTRNRTSFFDHYKEISEAQLPRAGRFFVEDQLTSKRMRAIYDSTATQAGHVLTAGLMAGASSPARPFFALTASDTSLQKVHAVKLWIADTEKRIRAALKRSRSYRALHTIYEELVTFGTAATILQPDFDDVFYHTVLTAGEYAIQVNYKSVVDTLYREFNMTVGQLVRQFGLESCSNHVKNLAGNKQWHETVRVLHAIEPREYYDPSNPSAKNMPWRSVYLELAGEGDQLLRESGYEQFPALVPRWMALTGEAYGYSPGMEVLGDAKQLQHQQLRKGQGIDYQSKPPLLVPNAMKGRESLFLPGGITYYDAANAGSQSPVKTAFDAPLRLDYLAADMEEIRGRIRSGYFVDLFRMFANSSVDRKTAEEIVKMHEEKLLMLGPVYENLEDELLEPLINYTFRRLWNSGGLLPPPPELAQVPLGVEFVSMLAQAQRAVGVSSVDRFTGSLGAVAQMKPEVLDKLNADAWADYYHVSLGVPPEIIVPDEKVAELRDARNRALAAKEQAEAANTAADTVQKLADSPTDQPNILNEAVALYSGYGAVAS